jgi:hypothetical protein
MKKTALIITMFGLAGLAFASGPDELATTAERLKTEIGGGTGAVVLTPALAGAPAGHQPVSPREQAKHLPRIRKILGYGGSVPEESKPFMNEWLPRFFAQGLIGRAPTKFEKREIDSWFPKLTERNDWRVTGEACDRYNCVSWSVGSTRNSAWPGDAAADFDEFYLSYGYIPLPAGEPPGNADAAYLKDAGGAPTHSCRRVAGDIWESKFGASLRVLHRLDEIEGEAYGFVGGLYRRGSALELAALKVTPKKPEGSGTDPCAKNKRKRGLTGAGSATEDVQYDLGSPYSRPQFPAFHK